MFPEHLQPYMERGHVARTEALRGFLLRIGARLRLSRARAAAPLAGALDPAAALDRVRATASEGAGAPGAI